MKTNAKLYEEIMERISLDPSIDDSNITIATHEGIVTIGGHVPNYDQKLRVEKAVKKISGVRAIANELTIKLSDFWTRSDSDIAKTALTFLKWDAEVPDEMVQLTVQNGTITLTGEVDYWFQKDKATKTVKSLSGVKDVINNLTIKPMLLSSDVKDKIIKEIEKSAEMTAKGIKVEVDKDKVILEGKVRSFIEYNEAERAAFSVPGVSSVENHLTIAA